MQNDTLLYKVETLFITSLLSFIHIPATATSWFRDCKIQNFRQIHPLLLYRLV